MAVATYRSTFAGIVLGGVSAYLTFHLRFLVLMDPSAIMRAFKAAAFAMVVPGLLAGIVSGSARVFSPWAMAVINFLFWFGFGWLFATFISKFIKLRRAIGAVGASSEGSSSIGHG